ncbi:hypothetical protein AB0L35_36575 [Streptomyces sp. NPDC052309]|uniref:hypothetical protein n=1 Tax=Streptomyces sp. NPDC052309 TaxID=3155421 RepID=UPI0034222364
MLARLPLGVPLLMAAGATLLLCLAAQRWFRPRGRTVAKLALVSAGCCLGMVVTGAVQRDWSVAQMLILYSFTLAGALIGLFPSRRLLSAFAEESRRGVRRDRYHLPVRHQAAFYGAVILMGLLAFVLAT